MLFRSEKTEAWLFFDDGHLYVAARCWDTNPAGIVADEMRRDSANINNNDVFGWGLDTFHNLRDMAIFEVSAAGGRSDAQLTNERELSMDWNPIWQAKAGRFEGGWVMEAAIPFKSLRYRPGAEQVWGIQFKRRHMAKNEYSQLTPVPAALGPMGHSRAALAATVVGLEVPTSRLNLDIKPYATAHQIGRAHV